MKKEFGVLLASGIGFLAVLGLISFKKMVQKKSKLGNSQRYGEYHPYFGMHPHEEDQHGIELLALK